MSLAAPRRAGGALLSCACLRLCLSGGAARAEPLTPAPEPPGRLDDRVGGAIVGSGIGTSSVGDTLLVDLGADWEGLRSLRDDRWLLQWSALLAARAGYLANEHPYLFLVGPHEIGWVEGGRRWSPARPWSPYAGARIGQEARILVHPGLALSGFDTTNSVDRVGGVVLQGVIRADLGASFLDGSRSLLLVAFVQEALHAAETNTPAQAFTEGGLGARLDLGGRMTASIEGVWGVTANRSDPLRGLSDRTTHRGAWLSLRKTFGNGSWLGASTSLERDSDHVVYSGGGGASYDTSNAPTFAFALRYGRPLGRAK